MKHGKEIDLVNVTGPAMRCPGATYQVSSNLIPNSWPGGPFSELLLLDPCSVWPISSWFFFFKSALCLVLEQSKLCSGLWLSRLMKGEGLPWCLLILIHCWVCKWLLILWGSSKDSFCWLLGWFLNRHTGLGPWLRGWDWATGLLWGLQLRSAELYLRSWVGLPSLGKQVGSEWSYIRSKRLCEDPQLGWDLQTFPRHWQICMVLLWEPACLCFWSH